MPLDTTVRESPAVASVVRRLTWEVEERFGAVYRRAIATCSAGFEEIAKDLTRAGWKDTPVGNLATDAFRAAFKTQIAVEAGGSTARPLEAGPIVPADIFRMVGYGFNAGNGLGYRMATWEISGAGIRAGLEFGLSSIEIDDEFLLQVSGLRYEYDPARSPGARLRSVRIGSRMLVDTLWYTVAANEFVLSFLKHLQVPARNIVVHENDRTEYQVIASWVERTGVLRPAREGRVRSVPGAPRPSR
jgi:2',3'-cyclic-nucleotide 2'-phosphodiesterase (5'-nucleotidase family)